MKWSQFVLELIENDKIILFNTYNKATVLLEDSEYNKINTYIKSNKYYNLDINFDYIKSLFNLGFLIDDNYDEKLHFYNKLIDHTYNNEKFNLVILTTTQCNFKCSYCYENGISRHNSFNSSDIKDIISIVTNYITNRKVTEINLTLFGGEPTLNWSFTENFLKIFKKFCDEHYIDLKTDIITNGYLLNKEKSDTLLKYTLNTIQITLDGMQEVHDNRRMLKNGIGTFNKIIKNLEYLASTEIKEITIRINYDKANANQIPNLLNFLSQKFNKSKNKFVLSFGIIDSNLNNDNDNLINAESDLQHYYLAFYRQAIDLGFKTKKYFETGSLCMAKIPNSIILSPDRAVYKCLSMVGMKEGIVGNLKSNAVNFEDYFHKELYEECFKKECEFIPMCYTGCRYKSFVTQGRHDIKDCNYHTLKKINAGIIKILYNL